jgi:hypothetical protein
MGTEEGDGNGILPNKASKNRDEYKGSERYRDLSERGGMVQYCI